MHYCEHEDHMYDLLTITKPFQDLRCSVIAIQQADGDQGPEFVSAAAVLCDADLQAQQAHYMFV